MEIMEIPSEAELARMRDTDIRTVDRESLVDIGDVKIDTKLPREERFREFLKQVRNPYCYRCGDVVVKVSFADTDITFEERMEQCIRNSV